VAHEIAVVVQQLVRADISGVLFTANPVTGSRAEMTGNFVYGLGDQLVSGEATGETFTLSRPKGRYEGPPALKRLARHLFKLRSNTDITLKLDDLSSITWVNYSIEQPKLGFDWEEKNYVLSAATQNHPGI
jgi:hypothetical protein